MVNKSIQAVCTCFCLFDGFNALLKNKNKNNKKHGCTWKASTQPLRNFKLYISIILVKKNLKSFKFIYLLKSDIYSNLNIKNLCMMID